MADIKCMELLLDSDISRPYLWQYVINQPGTALPTMNIDSLTEKLMNLQGPCDALYHLPGKLCPIDSVYSIKNDSFDYRFLYKYELR